MNGEREGVVLETPLIKGENRRNDSSPSSLFLGHDIDDEITLALRSCKYTSNYEMTKNMKRLGMERLCPFLFLSFQK